MKEGSLFPSPFLCPNNLECHISVIVATLKCLYRTTVDGSDAETDRTDG